MYMIKVFLVEDEVVIRDAIKNSINWEQEGYEFVGEASDGELALPMILKEKPDILITDIRMPFMDGLELSRLVKKELPDTNIIILSGYDEFEYAKEAIKIGVEEYLLKPISSNVLLEHLGEVASKIHEKQKEYEQRERRIREMREKYLSFQKKDCDDNINSIKSSDADFDINSVDDLKEIQDAIADFLSEGSPEDVPHFVEALLDKMPREHFRSIILRQYVIVNIFATVTSFCKKFEDKVEKTQTEEIAHLQELKDREKLLREALATAESQEDIQTYMTQLLANALEVRNTVSDRRYSDVILAAQKIIKKQYMSEDISLNTVAAEVGMSASYFSTIFSREMNQTFVEYLTEIRMNKAKELLTCSSLKTAESAFVTGYRDPHFFSSLFKKTQGCTPKEYRASRKG